jgi:hypothetical protein
VGAAGERRYSRGSLVVEVEGDGDALDARLGAGERNLLVRDDEGRVGRGGGGGEAEYEEGDEREAPRHGCSLASGLVARVRATSRGAAEVGNGSRLAPSLSSSGKNRHPIRGRDAAREAARGTHPQPPRLVSARASAWRRGAWSGFGFLFVLVSKRA